MYTRTTSETVSAVAQRTAKWGCVDILFLLCVFPTFVVIYKLF